MNNPAFLLGGGLNGLAVAQSLGRRSIPVYLFGVMADDIACRSRYVTGVEYSVVNDNSRIIEQIKSNAQNLSQKPVLLYVSDKFLEVSSNCRDDLKDICHLNLPSTHSVRAVIDKRIFGQFCAENDLPAPRTWAPESQSDIEMCLSKARFPVVIKPIFSHGPAYQKFKDDGVFAKMILVNDAKQLISYFSKFDEIGLRLIVQEYINGQDSEHFSYCSYRTSESQELVGFGFRKIRLHPIHGGVGTFAETYNKPDLIDVGREVVDKLQFKGVSSACFKRDISSGKLMLHEVNGRFPMGHSVGPLCGIDVPYVAYLDIMGVSVPDHLLHRTAGGGKWILLNTDFNSFRAYRAAKEITVWQWLKSLSQVRRCVEFAPDDLRPFAYFLKSLIYRAWIKLSRVTSDDGG